MSDYKAAKNRLTPIFGGNTSLQKNVQARRQWHHIFKGLMGEKLKPRIFYSTNYYSKLSQEISSQTSKN